MPKSRKWCLPDKTCRLLFECGKSSLHVPRMRHKIRLLENILTIYPHLAFCLTFMNIRYDTIETLS